MGTWDLVLVTSNYSTGFAEVYGYWVLGPYRPKLSTTNPIPVREEGQQQCFLGGYGAFKRGPGGAVEELKCM